MNYKNDYFARILTLLFKLIYIKRMYINNCYFISWDRWVVEDQVLKDTENNRSLMSRLHEQALKYVVKNTNKSEFQEVKNL